MREWPASLHPDRNGTIIATAVDLPAAMTVGRDRPEALERLADALATLLWGLMRDGEPVPRPSRPRRGQPVAVLPPLAAMKLAIYLAMREHGLSQAALAERLGVDGRQVRRLLDLDHASTLKQLEAALRALGKELVVEVRDAA